MTAINYLRKIEKDISQKSELTNRDGRKVYIISSVDFDKIISNYDNLIVSNTATREISIRTYNTYYQIFVIFKSAGKGRPKNNRVDRISEIYDNILNELSAHGYKYDK